ncbi:MAG: cytidine deaminase [Oscillospiraceae bacterium]|jgi:cytidine deaminase|nr:cytidine deaminase [Oscillospiraceae bacterium]
MTPIELVNLAIAAREHAYVPYSGFGVGAALLTKGGKVYQGCNIENAAYGPTNCAERTAFFTAVYEGERDFEAIAVVGGKMGQPISELCAPCGVCRQVIREFCNDDFKIYLSKGDNTFEEISLTHLLPFSFSKADLDK